MIEVVLLIREVLPFSLIHSTMYNNITITHYSSIDLKRPYSFSIVGRISTVIQLDTKNVTLV